MKEFTEFMKKDYDVAKDYNKRKETREESMSNAIEALGILTNEIDGEYGCIPAYPKKVKEAYNIIKQDLERLAKIDAIDLKFKVSNINPRLIGEYTVKETTTELDIYMITKKELKEKLNRLDRIDAIDLNMFEEMLIDIENDNYKIESVLSYIRAILDTLKG